MMVAQYMSNVPQATTPDAGTLKGIQDRYYAENVAPAIADLRSRQASTGQVGSLSKSVLIQQLPVLAV